MGYRPDRRRLLRLSIRETYKQARKNGQSDEATRRQIFISSTIAGGIVLAIGLAASVGFVCMIAVAATACAGIVIYAVAANTQDVAKAKQTQHATAERLRQGAVPPIPSSINGVALQARTPRIGTQSQTTQDNDKRQAAIMFRGFQRIGLVPLSKLKNGRMLYFKEPADRYRARADGSLEFIEHGVFLLTQHEVMFQVQGDYVRSLAKLTGASYSLADIMMEEGSVRDFYRMANPITAFVCLICLFKIAKVTPPVAEQKVRDLLTALTKL